MMARWAGPAYAPFDGIVVTAGAPVVPADLKGQLAVGGKLVIPVGDTASQRMVVVTRVDEGLFDEQSLDGFKFVPLIGRHGW
jgi:protein-L-isoaspartate(D-aspartate) O-methyltransferase